MKDDRVTHYCFEGRLTTRDGKRHISHRFMAPADAGQLDIRLRYAPDGAQGLSHMITLTVFDPAGFRGAGHRDGEAHHVHIAATEATPGYLPGPLPAGEWIVQLDTHRIMPGEAVRYAVDIVVQEGGHVPENLTPPASLSCEERGESGAPPSLRGKGVGGLGAISAPTSRGPGWYRGDLHSHTHHSDADGRTVADLIQMARAVRLDFIFLTDHNTTSGLAELDAAASDDLLTAAGVELTTFWGHALCLGTRAWVDWRVRPGTGEMARIAAALYDAGQGFVIAHPNSAGDPCCTGCAWRFGDMMPGNARLVEIWNGAWGGDSSNEAALALWYDWLNQGRRLAATAGSDTHGAGDYATRPGFNVVYAEALTEAALLKAMVAGHLYLSAGPRVTFQAQTAGGETWICGDTVTQPVTFTLAWADCPADAQIRVIANGKLLDQWPAAAPGDAPRTWRIAPDEADWVLAEIRGGDGAMLAVTNPIFLSQGRVF